MKNKGFTLVELIAVILILAVVILIAFTSITSFAARFRKTEHENIINNIEEAASKYAFDTGKVLIFVEELINEGYYEVDDDTNEIIDPLDNEKLNCYIVKMEKKGTYYDAKFKSDTKYELEDGKCDTTKLNIMDDSISIEVSNNGTVVNNTSAWIRGNNITLRAIVSGIDCTNNECIWTSSSGIKETGRSTINVSGLSLLKTKYTFQYNVYKEDSVERKTGSVELKIDNENPVIYLDDTIIYNKNELTTSKNVEISASDGNGSGISGYYLGNNSNCSGITYNNTNTIEVTANGTYTICVKDIVGNVSKSSIEVTNIG